MINKRSNGNGGQRGGEDEADAASAAGGATPEDFDPIAYNRDFRRLAASPHTLAAVKDAATANLEDCHLLTLSMARVVAHVGPPEPWPAEARRVCRDLWVDALKHTWAQGARRDIRAALATLRSTSAED